MSSAGLRRALLVLLPCGAGAVLTVLAIFLVFDVERLDPSPAINDHWHAGYRFFVCGERQPNAPTFEGGVNTQGDGIIHIHPFNESEKGSGSRLVKWFECGEGRLTDTEIRMIGSTVTYRNGDECPDGSGGELQVFVNSERLDDWSQYIPHDGDGVTLSFGPFGPEPLDQPMPLESPF